ncbi:MAG: alpha/beta hydrolase [Caulobacteraceae bacterium]
MTSEFAKDFYYKGSNTGILLIHSFTGTPSEVRYLGEYLRDKGYTVRGILLKGHGTTPEDMRRCSYRDWINSTVEGYKSLKQECDEVFAVGLSMGGLLSLYLARNYDIRGTAILSAPVKVRGRSALWAVTMKYFKRYVLKEPGKNELGIISYDKTPVKSIENLFKLISYIKANLRKIDKPILIMQSYNDKTVNPVSANIIYNSIGSRDKSIVYLHKSGHMITCDCEKEQVFKEVYNFINNKSRFKTVEEIKPEEARCSNIVG